MITNIRSQKKYFASPNFNFTYGVRIAKHRLKVVKGTGYLSKERISESLPFYK